MQLLDFIWETAVENLYRFLSADLPVERLRGTKPSDLAAGKPYRPPLKDVSGFWDVLLPEDTGRVAAIAVYPEKVYAVNIELYKTFEIEALRRWINIHPLFFTVSNEACSEFPVVGVKYRGKEAQEAFRQAQPGEPVELVRDPGNPHDPNAIKVVYRGLHVGFVPARLARSLAKTMDAAELPVASKMKGGGRVLVYRIVRRS